MGSIPAGGARPKKAPEKGAFFAAWCQAFGCAKCRPLRRRVCAANSLACRAQSRQCCDVRFALCVVFAEFAKGKLVSLPGAVPAMPRSPTHAPSLPLAGVPAPHLRNYRSHYTQTRAPLGASPVGVGLILPPHREGPHSPPTPLWRGFLHYTSGTNIRTVRKPRPRRCLCTGAGTHRLHKRNALPLGRTLSQTGFIDLLSADA